MTKQILAFLFCFTRELALYSPPYLIPHPRARTQTLYSPLTLSFTLVNQNKKAKICFVIYIAGFFFKFFFVMK